MADPITQRKDQLLIKVSDMKKNVLKSYAKAK